MLVHEQAFEALRRLVDELTERGEHRMPTERALAERLGMSRSTVRRALDLLEGENTIERVRGRAGGAYLTGVPKRDASPHAARSFCQSHSIIRSLNTVKGIPEILHDQGFRDGTTVIRAGLVDAPAAAASALGVPEHEPIVSLLRLRHADGETLSLEQMYLLPELAGLLRTEMKSVYRTLLSQFGVQICVADESIEIAGVSAAEGELLGQPAGTPVLKLERKGYDQHGRTFEYSVDLFRADRTRLHVRTQSPVTAHPM
jgi:GntR family transcriptional regulator